MDLFQLRGVIVEKELPEVDLFSLRGVIVEKEPPTVRLSHMRTLVAQSTQQNAQLFTARVLLAQTQSGYVNLPTDMTGLDRFKALAQVKLSGQVDWNTLVIGQPTSPPDTTADFTEVKISTLETSAYRGEITVNYRRRSIGTLAPLKLEPDDFESIEQAIEHIRGLGYLIDETDVNVAESLIEEDSMTLTAGDSSYFFYPGSRVVFGIQPILPHISLAFSSTTLPGF